jgi:general secretion pathway protein D
LVFDRGIAGGANAAQPLVGFPFNQQQTGNDNTTGSLATRENLAGQALSNLAMGRIDAGLGYGGLVLTAGNESVNFLLRALQNNTAAQVLARPQIMTLDNQVAFVQIGARVARIQGGSTSPQGGTTQNVVDVDVGVILRVQPRISPDGTVVMLLDTERSEVSETEGTTVAFSDDGAPLISPNINTTTAQTTLSARSGQTVVFAGLMQRDKAYERRSLPWFGTLPGIGWLFRFDQERERRRELLIIMTPYVIKDDEDYEWMNRMEMDRMSWCLSDVVEMHGNLGAGMAGAVFEDSGPSVIYPALDPTGTNNARPPEAESLNAPRPIQPTSSRRTSNPGPIEKIKAVVNWPRDAQQAGRHPLHVRQTAPQRNPLHRSQMGSREEPASYSPPPSQFRRPLTSDGPAQPIPSSEYPPPSGNGGAFIPSYLPTNGNTGRFDQQR